MFLDYETLRVIWWLLLGVLLIGFAVMDGFDLGVGTLLPFVARTDSERRVLINTIGPVWEGNQVWFVLGGGAIFAAWPPLYATAFSSFYLVMFLVLVALILRPVGFKFRSKLADPRWRTAWDWALFVGGFVPALIFGVALGNVLQGVPFRFDEMQLPIYEGGFLDLLNPFALLTGIVSVTMLAMHGATFLMVKTEGTVAERARSAAQWFAALLILLFALAGFWLAMRIDGFAILAGGDPGGPSNPFHKVVAQQPGAWLANYEKMPWSLAAPLSGFLGAALVIVLAWWRRALCAFLASSLAVIGIVATPGLAMFPFLLPSSSDPGSSLTVWDASSSHLTLFVMLLATVLILPVVVAYTAWVYRVLRGKITAEQVEQNDAASY